MKSVGKIVGRLPWRVLFSWVAMTLLSGFVHSVSAEEAAPVSRAGLVADSPVESGYVVGNGDELNFRFFHMPELNTVAVVRSDGRVGLPLIGQIPVVGLSLQELTQKVETALYEHVRRPQVVINVQGPIASQRVFVGGEVVRPGVQPLLGPLTAMQAVMAAEGLKDSARPREVIVLRHRAGGEASVVKLDLEAVMQGREEAADVPLAPYDVVIVPRSGIANVGVWIDQYVRRVLPINLGFSYTINRDGVLK